MLGGFRVDIVGWGWMWSFCQVSVKLNSVPNLWNTRNKQKRKLLLAEDGTVYKVKRSKMKNNVEAGQYV